MTKQVFSSNRHFTIFDFRISHGQLLLRSSKGDDNVKNIDIAFFGVQYIQLITSFVGLSIRPVSNDTVPTAYDSLTSFFSSSENRLFEIETNGEKYYIAASFFKVSENELEFNETSLSI